MSASDQPTKARQLCGKWMPRAKEHCARTPGHGGPCFTPAKMEAFRAYNRARRAAGFRETPEQRKSYNRKQRIIAYGITVERFGEILAFQGNACGMCCEPFNEGQRIHIDHDHAHCDTDCRACGECVRGLLCHVCNIALGHIQRRLALANAYLANPLAMVGGRGIEPPTPAL